MIIALKTDTPEALIVLLDDEYAEVARYEWTAHRTLARDLLSVIRDQLKLQNASWESVSAIILFRGPGSFTGLRISAAVANTIAHSQHIPIVGVEGVLWLEAGVAALRSGENHQVVLPSYGAEARITQPRK